MRFFRLCPRRSGVQNTSCKSSPWPRRLFAKEAKQDNSGKERIWGSGETEDIKVVRYFYDYVIAISDQIVVTCS